MVHDVYEGEPFEAELPDTSDTTKDAKNVVIKSEFPEETTPSSDGHV